MKIAKNYIITLTATCAFCLSGCTLLNKFSPDSSQVTEQSKPCDTTEIHVNKTEIYENNDSIINTETTIYQTDTIQQAQDEIAPSNENMTDLIDSLIHFSKQYLGKPYRASGNGPDAFDCSGFTSFVYGHFGIALNRSSDTQPQNGIAIKKQSDLKPGDLVFFCGHRINGHIGHVGIVTENDVKNHVFSFIHSSCSSGVIISKSNEAYYASRYVSACRVIRDSMPSFKHQDLNKTAKKSDKTSKQYYTVKSGDTLTAIARKHLTSVAKLCQINHISKEATLQIGQKIRIR